MKKVKTATEVTEQVGDEPHSVKFNVNQNLKMSAEIKVYAETPDKALSECARITKQVKVIIEENNKNGI
jgi:hypothetical protein